MVFHHRVLLRFHLHALAYTNVVRILTPLRINIYLLTLPRNPVITGSIVPPYFQLLNIFSITSLA
jgi:hypothetical protein